VFLATGCTFSKQDSVPAHRARTTMEFLEREMPEFISLLLWHPNSQDLNLVASNDTNYIPGHIIMQNDGTLLEMQRCH